MGSTLEHGIYLPSEGEKNCYQGLAGNWNKVDGALGDVAELKQLIESKFTKEIVTELPTEDINPYCIYMILKTDPETNNIYDEWVYINNAWEYLGNTQVDMTQYYTKQEVNELPAVASGVTSTKVGNYDTHIANGDIHVTASDKTKWNTVALIKQLRLVNAQVGSATTIAFANIDDTNGIKVGDKCMDLDAKLFEITAVDATNETVTVGSALIDIALDANVMHLTGDETSAGKKTFSEYITSDGSTTGDEYSNNAKTNLWLMSNRDTEEESGILIDSYRQNTLQGTGDHILGIGIKENTVRYEGCRFSWIWDNDLNGYSFSIRPTLQGTNQAVEHNLGLSTDKWSEIHGVTYYYGSSDTEFSQKFVTTDTVQDIEKDKNFKGLVTTEPDESLWPEVSNTTADITLLGNNVIHIEYRSSGKLTDLSGGAWNVVELGVGCLFFRYNNGTDIRYKHLSQNTVNRIPVVSNANRFINDVTPDQDNTYKLGSSSLRWRTINDVNPGSLSLPDLNNGVDISSYLTAGNSNNTYTPPANGWLSISMGIVSGGVAIFIEQGDMKASSYSNTTKHQDTDMSCFACLPVVAGVVVNIGLKGNNNYINSAKFFPCLGNV